MWAVGSGLWNGSYIFMSNKRRHEDCSGLGDPPNILGQINLDKAEKFSVVFRFEVLQYFLIVGILSLEFL